MVSTNEIYDSKDTVEDFALICKKMGYNSGFNQLTFHNGASASNLFEFFEDNPDAIRVLKDWILKHKNVFNIVEEEEEEEEEEKE